jgi:hypothetical protein
MAHKRLDLLIQRPHLITLLSKVSQGQILGLSLLFWELIALHTSTNQEQGRMHTRTSSRRGAGVQEPFGG